LIRGGAPKRFFCSHFFLWILTMTEVRASSDGCLGLIATNSYNTGDVIVEEAAPLVTLSTDESMVDESCLNITRENKKGAPKHEKGSMLLWSNVKVPSGVPSEQAGNFLGMVKALVSFSKIQNPEIVSRLLELYHPSVTSPRADERTIVEVAKEALKFIQKHAIDASSLSLLVKDQPEIAMKVMLVYSCNAFEGGRLYEQQSRINHSCDPNAIVQPRNGAQRVCAAAPIMDGEEITISYLGLFLYADGKTRREHLRTSKHFECSCRRCTQGPDVAAAIPCPSCHARHGRYLDEDTQYDDEQAVHYAVPPSSDANSVECQHCHEITAAPPGESSPNHVLQLTRTVSKKVYKYLLEKGNKKDKEDMAMQEEWEEQLLQLSSSVVGARHWATNLMMHMRLDRTLQGLHSAMLLCDGEVPDLTEVAECIDSLERQVRFVEGLSLRLHFGHLLSDPIIAIARTLVSLGDTKSKTYASEWLDKIKDYVDTFESDGMKKVVAALQVAWQKQDDGASSEATEEDSNKRMKLS
jgi:hypothetical protein